MKKYKRNKEGWEKWRKTENGREMEGRRKKLKMNLKRNWWIIMEIRGWERDKKKGPREKSVCHWRRRKGEEYENSDVDKNPKVDFRGKI